MGISVVIIDYQATAATISWTMLLPSTCQDGSGGASEWEAKPELWAWECTGTVEGKQVREGEAGPELGCMAVQVLTHLPGPQLQFKLDSSFTNCSEPISGLGSMGSGPFPNLDIESHEPVALHHLFLEYKNRLRS